MKEIVIATRNADKKKELVQLLKGLSVKVVSLDRYPDCPNVKEGNKSFRENAIRKAMTASKFTKKLALADDSGLETDALGGRPGIRSSRFAGMRASYAQNNVFEEQALPVEVQIPFASKKEPIDSPSIYLNETLILLQSLFSFGPFKTISSSF